jgi:hypothetical protein
MYIGDRKIEKIDWCVVHFADGKVKEYTPKQLSYLVTKKSKDLTEVRHLVLDNVLADLQALDAEDIEKYAMSIFEVLEAHDVTNIELQVILQRMLTDRVAQYNELVMATIWEETKQYSKDIETLKSVQQLVTDSYHKSFSIALWAMFGTYEVWKPSENCLEDIRMSDISRVIKGL